MLDWQTRCHCRVEDGKAKLELVQLTPTAGCDPDEPAVQRTWEHSLSAGASYTAEL